ncbi:MAG: TolB family protein, partial [Candidatus Binatia bacterium]
SRIAFHTNRTGTFEIFTMATDGSDLVNLTQTSGGSSPSWAPDGRIAFLSNRNTITLQLFVMESDGSGVTQITSMSFNAGNASWSPDSRQLVFDTGPIRIINDDGTGLVSITQGGAEYDYPTWSP